MKHAKKHRRSIRLKNYDYSQAGAYFITICVQDKECLFGQIADGRMALNKFGSIADEEWNMTAQIRENVELDEYVIMPNHLHGIIVILHDESVKHYEGVKHYAPTGGFRSPSQNLGSAVRGFKSAVTKRMNELRKTPGSPVWQRNYWERVIRNEEELNKAREYILNNPLKWELDKENPANVNR